MTTRGVTIELAALLVYCEVCLAEEGDGCWDAHGKGHVPLHNERIAEAERLIKDALDCGAITERQAT